MTKEQFEAGYAKRSGTTMDYLTSLGLGAVPCDCGEEICEGWGMVNLKQHAEMQEWEKRYE